MASRQYRFFFNMFTLSQLAAVNATEETAETACENDLDDDEDQQVNVNTGVPLLAGCAGFTLRPAARCSLWSCSSHG